MKKNFLLLFLVISTINAKEGFIFSIGLGGSFTNSNFKKFPQNWNGKKEDNNLGLATSFKLGYGVNEQLSFYIIRNSSFVFGYKQDPKKETYGNCITGLAIEYKLNPTKPTYLIAGFGKGQLSKWGEDDSDANMGKAFILGLGYEISPTISIETTYLATRVNDDVDVNSNSLQVTLNYYFY